MPRRVGTPVTGTVALKSGPPRPARAFVDVVEYVTGPCPHHWRRASNAVASTFVSDADAERVAARDAGDAVTVEQYAPSEVTA